MSSNTNDNWWATCLIWALATAIITFALLPTELVNWKLITAGACLAFAATWMANPRNRYKRLASQVLAFWVVSSAGSKILFHLGAEQGTAAFSFETESSWVYDLSMGLAFVVCIVLDYLSTHSVSPSFNLKSSVIMGSSTNTYAANSGSINTIAHAGEVHIYNNQPSFPSDTEITAAIDLHAGVGSAAVREGLYHDKIDAATEYMKSGSVDVALDMLHRLKKREWDKLNPREKFRTLANIGHCLVNQERFDEAFTFFEEASTFQPDDAEAQAIVATAYYLVGNDSEAKIRAQSILTTHPNVAAAIMVVIRTDDTEKSTQELWESVPIGLRSDPPIQLSIAWRAIRTNEFTLAHTLAAKGIQDSDYRTQFEIMESSATVSELATQRTLCAPLTQDEKERLIVAITTLKNASNVIMKGRGKLELGQIYFNLAVANRLLENDSETEYFYRRSIEAWPSESLPSHQFAKWLVEQRRSDEAILTLTPIANAKDPEACAQLAFYLALRNLEGDHPKAIDLLHLSIEHHETLELISLCNALNLLGRLTRDSTSIEEMLKILARVQRDDLSDAHRLALEANVYRAFRMPDEVTNLLQRASAALTDSDSETACWEIANACKEHELFEEGLSAYMRFVTPDSQRDLILPLIECADRCDNTTVLLDFCKALRAHDVFIDEAIELEAYTRERFDDVEGILDVLDSFLAIARKDYFSKLCRLRRAVVGIKYRREELLNVSESDLPTPDEASPEIGKLVIRVLQEKGLSDAAISYSYVLLRKHFNQSDAHRAFANALGFPACEVPIPDIETIDGEAGFSFAAIGQEERGWWILEGDDARQERHELPPNHPISIDVQGKKAGDEFVLRSSDFHKVKATITEVASKYVFRMRDTVDHWEDRFPQEFFVYKFSSKTPEGDPDITPLLQSMEHRAASKEHLHDVYRSNGLSTTSFAVMTGGDAIDAASHLASEEALQIRCCYGNEPEHDAAESAIISAQEVILCPSALATLWLTECWRAMEQLPFKLTATLSLLEQVRRRSEDPSFRGRGFLNRLTRGKVAVSDDEDSEPIDSTAKEFYAWLMQVCSVENGILLSQLSSTARSDLTRMFGNEVAQSVAIAKHREAALWCDDLGVAEFSRLELKVQRFWTEVLLTHFATGDRIPESEYHRLLAILNGYGYSHTRLTPNTIVSAAELADWDAKKWPFAALRLWFQNPDLDPVGIVQVAGFSLPMLWRAAPLPEQAAQLTHEILQSVGESPKGTIELSALIRHIDRFFGVDVVNAAKCLEIANEVARSKRPPRRIILPGDGGAEL